ncbi:LLM class flavin-dependent oxidoreductase [Saxibacter everestensis]|uniref:LLM class flavin-dependent oxidoreductase n=1 Tax=Saxibacter everestensis TaxID=2909229 RepID=A0ABY8QU42_9MICO|nr:LLM class flavin-dependent oxidoreductase [Brevibacteriaceae bacterium ZFBP1038]
MSHDEVRKNPLKLSALDLVPVRTDQTTGSALAASVDVAQAADAAGYTRYWVAEHHNMPAVAATSPPVVISHLAARTERIRVGSGGVMLPNHAPLAVAEQFALLEAAYPDRIDLGIGRAPGSDPVTSMALRGHVGQGTDQDPVQKFPEYVADVIALMSARGVNVPMRGGSNYVLRATPNAVSEPKVWLLGSSGYSAQLAAANGMPYVFAHHFAGQGTAAALQAYRSQFRPSDLAARPTTFLTVNAVVAESDDEARELALPQLQAMARLRSGEPLQPLALVQDAADTSLPAQQLALIEGMRQHWIIGTPSNAAGQLRQLAKTFGVDEVMVNPVASAHRGEPADSAEARVQTLRLLGKELL